MKLSELKNLRVDDIVYCLDRYPEMPHGWVDSMDDLIGEPLIVREIKGSSILIASNKSAMRYTFNYKYLEVADSNTIENIIHFEGRVFAQKKLLTKDQLKAVMLESDYNIYKRMYNGEKVTTSMLESAKKHVPRLIGVLLAHRYIEEIEANHDAEMVP